MKTKLYLIFFFVFPLFMSACRGDDPMPDPPVDGKRTVLVYMAADNSINPLASFTDGDLEELKAGMASIDNTSDMHLLVYIDTGSPRLIEIENKGGTVVETIVKEYEDRNSCGVAETQEVFNDVFGNSLYKAESYGLIYWSHGEGWIPTPLPSTRWIGNDKTGGGHYMNIEDLKLVLQNAPHFDFIMFDACFMQSVEVAYELRDCCDYYIGFPAENPGPGAAYDRMFPFIFQKGAAVEMAIGTFAAYDEIYTGKIGSNSNWTMGTAIDVLKSSELENLAAATANALSGVTADREVLRSSVFDYDQRKVGSSYYVGYYDFVEMMEKLVVDEVVLDEYDEDQEYIKNRGKGEYVMEGKTPLKEVEELLDITFDEEEFETLNGFLISRLDRIPEPDEQFDVDYKGYNFKILSVVKKMIGSVLVKKLPEEKTLENAEDGQSVLEEKQK